MNNEFEYKRGLDTGTRLERERIIKLIIDNDVIGSEWWIRLIKGENE